MREQRIIGVAGLGLLGRGIVASLLAHGHRVIVWTIGEDTHEKAGHYIDAALQEMAAHGLVPAGRAATWRDDYVAAEDFQAFAPCNFVIESVTEDLTVKQSVFDTLEAVVAGNVPIASNTSAIPISLLQGLRQHPERFLGMHWAEPAYATRFLELIRGEHTSDATMESAMELGIALGKEPAVLQRDVPGFIANRLGYAMYREALHLLESGVADVETIDRSFRNACGLWAAFCGPFRWMDITGGPALYAKAMQTVLPDLANSPELPAEMRERLARGERGVLDGRGFYPYSSDDGEIWSKRFHDHAWKVWDLVRRDP